jgi:hypothetical protein
LTFWGMGAYGVPVNFFFFFFSLVAFSAHSFRFVSILRFAMPIKRFPPPPHPLNGRRPSTEPREFQRQTAND